MQRDLGIESLRTMALFWIVLVHVAGISPNSGLGLNEVSVLRYVVHTLAWFPIPMFALVAGYVYAFKPLQREYVSSFVQKKFSRIALPGAAVALVTILLQAVVPGTNTEVDLKDIFHYVVFPNSHIWFLYALLWVHLFAGLFDVFRWMDRPMGWLLVIIAAAAVEWVAPITTNAMALNKVPYMLPFFLLGYGLNRHVKLWTPNVRMLSMIVGFFLLAFQQWVWFSGIEQTDTQLRFAERLGSWMLLPLIFFCRPNSKALAFFAPWTFVIYLFHPIVAAAARIGFGAFTNITDPLTLFVCCYVISVVGSMAMFIVGKYVFTQATAIFRPAVAKT